MMAVPRLSSPRSPSWSGRPDRAALAARPAQLLEIPGLWRRRRRFRAELTRLMLVGPYMVDDIGLPATYAVAEARKPFWRA